MSGKSILSGLGGLGLGAVGGVAAGGTVAGVGGYLAGHSSGMKRDAETPYGRTHMRYAYGKGRGLGRREVISALRRQAYMRQMQARRATGRGKVKKAFILPAAAGGLTGAAVAPEGQRAAGGLGGIAGGILGGVPAGIAGSLAGGAVGGAAGSVGGGVIGGMSGATIGLLAGMALKSPVLMAELFAGGGMAGAAYGGAAGGMLGGAAGSLGGAIAGGVGGGAAGGYVGSRIVAPKTKKAFVISPDVLEAAEYVQVMRKSAHVNLQIPDYIRGY